jgi:hypothetical protein
MVTYLKSFDLHILIHTFSFFIFHSLFFILYFSFFHFHSFVLSIIKKISKKYLRSNHSFNQRLLLIGLFPNIEKEKIITEHSLFPEISVVAGHYPFIVF